MRPGRHRLRERQTALERQQNRSLELVKGIADKKKTQAQIIAEIAAIMDLPTTRVKKWLSDFPLYKDKFRDIIEASREEARLALAGALPQAVEVIKETIKGKSRHKLKYLAAHDTVKGFGVLVEKQEQEVKGLVGIFNADDFAREYRAAKKGVAKGSE